MSCCRARTPGSPTSRAWRSRDLDLRPVGDPALPADGAARHAGWPVACAVSGPRPPSSATGAVAWHRPRYWRARHSERSADPRSPPRRPLPGGAAGDASLPLQRGFRRGDARGRRHARHPDPPSVVLVLYAIIAEQNIGRLFAAALLPGVLGGGAVLRRDRAADARWPNWGRPNRASRGRSACALDRRCVPVAVSS